MNLRAIFAALVLSCVATNVAAQSSGSVPLYSIPIGKGPGVSGFGSAAPGTAGKVLMSNGASANPSFQTIGGASFGAQTANTIFAGPTTGAAANPTFRALVAADMPLGTAGYALIGNGASVPSYQGFAQSGTGAATRTWNTKVAETISVKDFGAVGDGSTDDTTAISNAATAACGTLGTGGASKGLYFPAGFYKTTTLVTITCGLTLYGDGFSADSGRLLQSTVFSTVAALSGSIILPSSTNSGINFTTNQAVTVRDIGIVYLTRPSAASGIYGLKIQAAGSATGGAGQAWNSYSEVRHAWFWGADQNVIFTNLGQFTFLNNSIQMHASNGLVLQGPNLPYAGDWLVSGNTFISGSVTNCAQILVQSGGAGRIIGNKINTCGSNNATLTPPLTTTGILYQPNLNVASNSVEPPTITGNSIEGLSYGIRFDGSVASQNASASQIAIVGNQIWAYVPISTTTTATNTAWMAGMVISGNYLTAQTVNGSFTTTSNISVAGIQLVTITGNQMNLVQGAGGDTSTAITIGTAATTVQQLANQVGPNVTMPTTVTLAAPVTGSGGVLVEQTSPTLITPVLGVATGTSLALAGCTIGTDKLCVTGTATITSASATALTAGLNGATNPALQIDASTASSATGLKVKSAAAAGGLALSVITSGTNENLTIDAAGSGTITLGGTSTGNIVLNRATTFTSSLTGPLVIGGTAAGSSLSLQSTSGVGTTDFIKFLVGNNGATEAMRLSTGGNVLIGTTAPQTIAAATPTFQMYGNAGAANLSVVRHTTPGTGGAIVGLSSSRGTSPGSFSAIQSGDGMGQFFFNGDTGSALILGGRIYAVASENWSGTTTGMTIRFDTTTNGTTGQVERMRLQASGGLSIGGVTTDPGIGGLYIDQQAYHPAMLTDATLTDNTVCLKTGGTGQLLKGSGALGVCLGTSGRQFKTGFEPMQAGLREIMKINMLNYRYKEGFGDSGAHIQYGPTAQDVEAVLPGIARQNTNGETINYDWPALMFVGLRAIQELKLELNTLKETRK